MKPDEYRKYLERRISIMQEEIDYLRGRLKALDNGEDISDSDSDEEHFYLDNINGV